MPTVLREGGFRFFFYSGDRNEPSHVHVAYENRVAKVWLDPVSIHASGGLSRALIRRILRIIQENHILLVEAWDEYFND